MWLFPLRSSVRARMHWRVSVNTVSLLHIAPTSMDLSLWCFPEIALTSLICRVRAGVCTSCEGECLAVDASGPGGGTNSGGLYGLFFPAAGLFGVGLFVESEWEAQLTYNMTHTHPSTISSREEWEMRVHTVTVSFISLRVSTMIHFMLLFNTSRQIRLQKWWVPHEEKVGRNRRGG